MGGLIGTLIIGLVVGFIARAVDARRTKNGMSS